MRYYTSHHHGDGFLNSAINKLPFELHLPGYNFCGPGTKLEKRLARGDMGINPLDEACKQHDIAYANYKDLKERHQADNTLLKNALSRISSGETPWRERLAAIGVSAAMKAKLKLGMGIKSNKLRDKMKKSQLNSSINNKSSSSSIIRKSSTIMTQSVKAMQNYLKKIETLIKKLDSFKVDNYNNAKKSLNTKKETKRKTLRIEEENDDERLQIDNYHEKKIKEKMMKPSRKRQAEDQNQCGSSKRKKPLEDLENDLLVRFGETKKRKAEVTLDDVDDDDFTFKKKSKLNLEPSEMDTNSSSKRKRSIESCDEEEESMLSKKLKQ